MMPTLASLVALEIVTTTIAKIDDKDGIMTKPKFPTTSPHEIVSCFLFFFDNVHN